MLQSQLYASLANSVAAAITGQNAQNAGTITLNTMTLSGPGSCGAACSGPAHRHERHQHRPDHHNLCPETRPIKYRLNFRLLR